MCARRDKRENELEGPVTEVAVELPPRTLLVKCPGCRRVIDQGQLSANYDVCPRCGHHLRVNAQHRLRLTVDADSFEEWYKDLEVRDFLKFPGYAEKLDAARAKTGEADAVVCGRATIRGRACAIFVMNGDFMMGSMGSVVGEKICRTFERAIELGLPVVGFTVSGGARMQEGTTSLMQMAKVSAARRRLAEACLPYACVLTDPTTGGVTASFAMEGDVILAEPGALVAFAGPRVIEQTTHKRLPAGFQRSEFQLEHGFVDRIVPRRSIPDVLGELLALLAGEAPEEGSLDELKPEPAPKLRPRRRGKDEVDAYARVTQARSTSRPTPLELIERAFDGFVELHGDRLFGDDAAVVAGLAWVGRRVVMVCATERGRTTKERVERNFGSAHPEGYRKALRLMHLAERFGLPVVCLVDTAGAFCGIGAEERGQGEAIATNLVEMSGLSVPVVSAVVGEGGSGGALALAVADRVLMLGSAVYSVVSPEGCASILWKTAKRAPEAADALGLTASDLMRLGIVDDVVDDEGLTADELAHALLVSVKAHLDELARLEPDELVRRRYERFRGMGAQALVG